MWVKYGWSGKYARTVPEYMQCKSRTDPTSKIRSAVPVYLSDAVEIRIEGLDVQKITSVNRIKPLHVQAVSLSLQQFYNTDGNRVGSGWRAAGKYASNFCPVRRVGLQFFAVRPAAPIKHKKMAELLNVL